MDEDRSIGIYISDFFRLKCPACSLKICRNTNQCEVEDCPHHHYAEHNCSDIEEMVAGIAQQPEATRSQIYKETCLAYYAVGGSVLLEFLLRELDHLLNEEHNAISIGGNNEVWKLNFLLPICMDIKKPDFRIQEGMEEMELLYPNNWAFRIRDESEHVEKLMGELTDLSLEHPSNCALFVQLGSDLILNLIQKQYHTPVINRAFKFYLSKMKQFSWKDQTNSLMMIIKNKTLSEAGSILYQSTQALIALFHRDETALDNLQMSDLQTLEEMLKTKGNGSMAYRIWNVCYVQCLENPSTESEMKAILNRGELIFVDFKEISTYTTFSRMVYRAHDTVFSPPPWVTEKLIAAPEKIPLFNTYVEETGVHFDLDAVLDRLPTEKISEILLIGHVAHLHTNSIFHERIAKLLLENKILYQDNLDHLATISTESMNQGLNGFCIDLPNLMRLTKKRNDTDDDHKIYRESCKLIIEWINSTSKVDCYIHTTPTFCRQFSNYIELINHENRVTFVCYRFDSEVDEDHYFLNTSMAKNTWILTRDKLVSHGEKMNMEALKVLQLRTLLPYYNREEDSIQFFIHPAALGTESENLSE
jgi:hypothetical protein